MRAEPSPRFPIAQWRLGNGLRVVVQSDPGSPLIAATVCYGAGSRWDPAARSGLAHLCEHLAFQGPTVPSAPSRPDRAGSGPGSAGGRGFPARIESAGGTTQAATLPDRLSFSAVFPRAELTTVLAVEAERMACPLLPEDSAALEVQRRVLLEELRERSRRRVRATAFEQLHRQLFPPEHPYHRPPAGEPEGIRAVTGGDVAAFAASRIRPDNAILVLAGDVPETAAGLIEEAFGSLPAGGALPPAPAAPREILEDAEEERCGAKGSQLPPIPPIPPGAVPAQSLPAAVGEPHAHVAWLVPGFGREGWYEAVLLLRALAIGRSSPLARVLVEEAALAQEVNGYLVSMRDASTLVFAAAAARGVEGPRLEQALVATCERLLAGGLSEAGLARGRKKALADHYLAAESLERRADLCACLASYFGAPERLSAEPARYSALGRDAVAAFAAGLLRQATRATLRFAPAVRAA